MNKQDVMVKLNEIFKDVFDDDTLVITEETYSGNIEDWDSLSHLELIASIENEFKIKFKLDEIKNMLNVGQMCACILKHLEADK